MVLPLWYHRGPKQADFNPVDVYGGNPNLFSIELNHGGRFTKFPGRRYVNGKIDHFDMIDSDLFSVHEVDAIIEELGYPPETVMYYHFLVPGSDLDIGLQALGNDMDVITMLKYVPDHKVINVYIEQGDTKLHTYFQSPQAKKLTITEISDEPVLKERPRKLSVRKPLAIQWHNVGEVESIVGELDTQDQNGGNVVVETSFIDFDEVVDHVVNQRKEPEDVNVEVQDEVSEGVDHVVNKGKEPEDVNYEYDRVSDEDLGDPESGSDEDGGESESGSDDDEGESESGSEDKDGGKNDDGGSSDAEDRDYLVDEEYEAFDPVIDMKEFKASVDVNVNEDVMEVDINVNEEVDIDDFDSPDDDEIPLESAMRKIRKEKKQQHKDLVVVPFYLGQAFHNREEIHTMVSNHAVDSMRQLYISRNDDRRFTVICMGLTPLFNASNQEGSSVNSQKNKTVAKETSGPQGALKAKSKSGSKESSMPKKKNPKKNPKPTCSWRLHLSNKSVGDPYVVKTFCDKHLCLNSRNVKMFNIPFIAKELKSILEVNPQIKLTNLQDLLQKKFKQSVSLTKVAKAKKKATKLIQGDYKNQYKILRTYAEELIKSNPGTTVTIDVEQEANPSSPTRQFRRIYVCLGGMKLGFKQIGREILGLDGTFMKGPYPGQVLTAVGVDSNNGIYPVAYAIVEAESFSSWSWFLECLGRDLDIEENSNFTFISDRQKGIIPAIAKVFPSAEHRFCLRHIQENMRQQWRGPLFKDLLWKCATATTIPKFERAMETIKEKDEKLYDWLKQIPPKHWARSHFTGRAKCDILLNNICEVFNRQLVCARDKPIFTCLEFIREYMMRRILAVHKMIARSIGPLTPTATRLFTKIKEDANLYKVLWNSAKKYQVSGPWMDQVVVDMDLRTCTCRRWELTGMPCRHVVAVIWEMALTDPDVGHPESWVSEIYWVETWKKVYQHTVDPTLGRPYWTPSRCPTTLLPPKHHKQIGRPKKKRRKSAEELNEVVQKSQSKKKQKLNAEQLTEVIKKGTKLTRMGNTITCGNCKQKGHNKRTCKN